MLYPVEQLWEINKAAEMSKYAPGFVLFGSDGGGMSYAFDGRDARMSIVELDDETYSVEGARSLGSNIGEFLAIMAASP